MQLDFLFNPLRTVGTSPHKLNVAGREVPILFVRNHRAKRYILRVKSGSVRATVPRGGSVEKARRFAEQNFAWIAKQLQKPQPTPSHAWQHGTEFFYRGDVVALHVEPSHNGNIVTFGDQIIRVAHAIDLRAAVECHLWRLAAKELYQRTMELAKLHNVIIHRITVRNQRSRWGSCSRRGTISLNWRLIQAPVFVRDYIIQHELMHRREANHSKRYWQHVEEVCPGYEKAEAWLKQHRRLLR
ncbi:MAG: M48 family metallopeptidase [Verrucomicrobia bacterium]|nr:M48 family metallopeptidase [Verrucomicrobiota bacterium]